MPPKLFLNVDASVTQSIRGKDEDTQVVAPSIEIGPSGTLKLYKSFQAYEFNKSGMVRNTMTSPLATGAAALQQSYQIAENDVQFIRTLGQGASGLVQKAFWPAKAEFVAIKKISILEREKRHQLMNDIKALCNTPDVLGLIRFRGAYHSADRGQIAVALEYMDGGSLADVLERVGRIPEDVLAAMTVRVLSGLVYLHTNHTVHRDIKPANILCSTAGEPKVSDFGISAFVDNTLAQCHTFLGTVTYMSPERINGQPYSFPADIWALGLTLLECATGRYPYDASGGTIQLMIQLLEEECPLPREKEASTEFRDFVKLCMAKDPMARPTAEDLLRHPWIRRAPPVDLRKFMRCMYHRDERVADAVAVCSARFYNNLSYNWLDSDTIAAFYSPEATLTVRELRVEASATGASELQQFKGKYTLAERFRSLAATAASRVATGDVAFVVSQQKHQPQGPAGGAPLGDEGIVVITQRVILQDESGRVPMSHLHNSGGDENAAVVASYDETVTVRLRDVDALVPGLGFSIVAQEVRWIQPLVGRKGGREHNISATPPKCRQQ